MTPTDKDRETARAWAVNNYDLLRDPLVTLDAVGNSLADLIATERATEREKVNAEWMAILPPQFAEARRAARAEAMEEASQWLKDHDHEWCCCNCGASRTNREDWCDLGCGNDYNAMIRIDHWTMPRLLRHALAGGETKEPAE